MGLLGDLAGSLSGQSSRNDLEDLSYSRNSSSANSMYQCAYCGKTSKNPNSGEFCKARGKDSRGQLKGCHSWRRIN